METLILIAVGLLIYFSIFYESDTSIQKLRKVLKSSSDQDLMLLNTLIENELNERNQKD